jgi:hypothetical protein
MKVIEGGCDKGGSIGGFRNHRATGATVAHACFAEGKSEHGSEDAQP